MTGRLVVLALGLALGSGALAAQVNRAPVGPLARATSAERLGDYVAAAAGYIAALDDNPGNVNAILGLTRVLPPLERREELAQHLDRALAVDSMNPGFLAAAVRNQALLGRRTAARLLVERWSRLIPEDEEPYREWALTALEIRDRGAAKEALELGRARISHPAALAPELAQLRQSEGDLVGATNEWLRAIANVPGFRASALLLLGDVPEESRSAVLTTLRADGGTDATRLEGLLLARWGQPVPGAERVLAALPTDQLMAVSLIRSLIEELRGRTDRESEQARGRALEALADRETGETAIRTRMDAARAYANAADEVAARRLLARIAADPLASGGVATAATTTLLGVLIAESRPAEAESLFVTLRESLSLDDREREQRRLAMAWARSGNLERAEAMLEGDSTVAGFDVRGRLRAFAGDLALATTWLRLAGPYDDDRESAVARVRLLALLQAVEADSLPALGAALLDLERADTSRAIAAFESIAATIKPPGAAALRLLAGELARDQGDLARAVRLLADADASEAPATAPSARLALADLHIAAGRRKEAAALLERLILDYPESAVLPEARRARDLLMRIPLGAT
ncbi:MAG: hypothetical protein CVV20_00595 [Gemmatimonadetes bacterium HGW-Gemmatimonadetes-1]|nr:MAG: hypothetical protein CVV20_00595 [Gemmatimonadetes bacterium HGW-Gemmatimonadetes-1]